MNARSYVLVDILECRLGHAMKVLQTLNGVVADTLEGHPNIMVVIEAQNREELAERVMPVLELVDCITNDIHLIMNKEDNLVRSFPATVAYARTSVN